MNAYLLLKYVTSKDSHSAGTQSLQEIYNIIEQIRDELGVGFTLSLKSNNEQEREADHKRAMEVLVNFQQRQTIFATPPSVNQNPELRDSIVSDLIEDFLEEQEPSSGMQPETLKQKRSRLNTILLLVENKSCSKLTLNSAVNRSSINEFVLSFFHCSIINNRNDD